MALLRKIREEIGMCLTNIVIGALNRKIEYYESLIEKNYYIVKYCGFLPFSDFDLDKIKELEKELHDSEEVRQALDVMFDSIQSDETESAYKKMDVTRSGNLTMDEVIQGFKLDECMLTRYILSTFDKNGNQVFELDEFKELYGDILINEDKIIFEVLDVNLDGRVTVDDVLSLLKIRLGNDFTRGRQRRAKIKIERRIPREGWTLGDFQRFFRM